MMVWPKSFLTLILSFASGQASGKAFLWSATMVVTFLWLILEVNYLPRALVNCLNPHPADSW
jgi:hypothetical protein